MNIKKILFFVLLLLGLGVGVFLVQRVQETRKRAVYTQAEVWWLPEEIKESSGVGDNFSVSLVADWGGETVEGFAVKIKYSKDLLDLGESIEVNSTFTEILKVVDEVNGEVELRYVAMGTGATGVMGITDPWVKLNFEILAEGAAEVRLVTSELEYSAYQISGNRTEGDNSIELLNRDGSVGDGGIMVTYVIGLEAVECSVWGDCSIPTTLGWGECNQVDCANGSCVYSAKSDGTACTNNGEEGTCSNGGCANSDPIDVSPTAVPTDPAEEPTSLPTSDWPVLNFLVKFSGITEDTDYNQSSVVDVTVVSTDGSEETYGGVGVAREEGRDVGVYRGTVELVGFNRGMNNSVLIDGPKHLQTKFCNANQSTVCTSYTGSVVLMERGDDAPLYNFSGWEIAAGDIPNTDGVRDGVVDVADYTRVVEALGAGRRREESYVSRCDINGNGIVDTLDLGALLETLSERYGELY